MQRNKKESLKQGNYKKWKLKEEHKTFIDDLITRRPFSRWTWSKIKAELNNNFSDMPNVHNSIISRYMNKELNLSFKKLEFIRPPALTQIAYRKIIESALLRIELMKKYFEIIYIDEFHVNTRHHRFRGWTRKGQKGFITVDSKDFSMSFF